MMCGSTGVIQSDRVCRALSKHRHSCAFHECVRRELKHSRTLRRAKEVRGVERADRVVAPVAMDCGLRHVSGANRLKRMDAAAHFRTLSLQCVKYLMHHVTEKTHNDFSEFRDFRELFLMKTIGAARQVFV